MLVESEWLDFYPLSGYSESICKRMTYPGKSFKCYRVPAAPVDYVLKEVFNLSDSAIQSMRNNGADAFEQALQSQYFSDDYFYSEDAFSYLDGYYYYFSNALGVGGPLEYDWHIHTDGSESPFVSRISINAPEKAYYKKPFVVSITTSQLPEGAQIKWTTNSNNAYASQGLDNKSFTLTPKDTGTFDLTVTIYSEDGEKLAEDSVNIVFTYAWWQWLIRIFLLGFIWY